jgi:hypothetical protein
LQSARQPRVDPARHLTVQAPEMHGPDAEIEDVTVILEPVGAPDLGLVSVRAALRVRRDGSDVQAALPPLPPATAWSMWFRVGPVGGPPPWPGRLEVRADRDGVLSVRSPADD